MTDKPTRPEAWKDFGAQLDSIMMGQMFIPNFEEEKDLSRAVANWASAGGAFSVPGVRSVKFMTLPGGTGQHTMWARYLLHTTQSGRKDGSGYVLFYDQGKGRAGKFAICKHEGEELPGADHRRGWHPSVCKKCGLDLTVDSSD